MFVMTEQMIPNTGATWWEDNNSSSVKNGSDLVAEHTATTPTTAGKHTLAAHAEDTQMKIVLSRYLPIPIVLLGAFFNSLTIAVVAMDKKFRYLPFGILMIALSVCDSLQLLVINMSEFTDTFVKLHDIRYLCRFAYISIFSVGSLTTWTVLCLTAERLVGIWKPFTAKRFFTARNTKLALGILTVVTVSSYTLAAVFYDITTPICPNTAVYRHMMTGLATLFTGLPLGATCISYIVLVVLVCRKRGHQACSQSQSAQLTRQVTVAAVCVCGTTLALTMPLLLYRELRGRFGKTTDNKHEFDPGTVILLQVYKLNHMLNFFIYILSSKQFRVTARKVLCCSTAPSPAAQADTAPGGATSTHLHRGKPGPSDSMSGTVDVLARSTVATSTTSNMSNSSWHARLGPLGASNGQISVIPAHSTSTGAGSDETNSVTALRGSTGNTDDATTRSLVAEGQTTEVDNDNSSDTSSVMPHGDLTRSSNGRATSVTAKKGLRVLSNFKTCSTIAEDGPTQANSPEPGSMITGSKPVRATANTCGTTSPVQSPARGVSNAMLSLVTSSSGPTGVTDVTMETASSQGAQTGPPQTINTSIAVGLGGVGTNATPKLTDISI